MSSAYRHAALTPFAPLPAEAVSGVHSRFRPGNGRIAARSAASGAPAVAAAEPQGGRSSRQTTPKNRTDMDGRNGINGTGVPYQRFGYFKNMFRAAFDSQGIGSAANCVFLYIAPAMPDRQDIIPATGRFVVEVGVGVGTGASLRHCEEERSDDAATDAEAEASARRTVIARNGVTKQSSIRNSKTLDCFAPIAMTEGSKVLSQVWKTISGVSKRLSQSWEITAEGSEVLSQSWETVSEGSEHLSQVWEPTAEDSWPVSQSRETVSVIANAVKQSRTTTTGWIAAGLMPLAMTVRKTITNQ